MQLICDTNYDKELHSVITESSKPDAHYLMDVTYDKKEGWLHKYLNETRPQLK